ncbi:MAG: ATP-binding protein [Bacteroidales bacterium]|nr:ATP-binding protein [Bacteroidales bacterium]
MGIDIKTIAFVLGITHLIQILVFIYQYRVNKHIKGPGWWLLWSAFESLGFILIILRAIPSLTFTMIIFQNIVILLGTIFIYIGLIKFFNRKVNFRFLGVFFFSFLMLHIYFIFIHDDISIRSVNLAIYLSIISFTTAFYLQKYKTKSTIFTANFNIIIFIVHGCVFAYRAVLIITGTSVTEVFTPSLFNFIPYFDALIVSLLWTFGFIMMVNQRLNSEISEAKTHFELIFNTSPDASIITQIENGLFIDCNESFIKLLGYSKADINGKSTLNINIWGNPDDRNEMLRRINEYGFCENFECAFRRKNDRLFVGLLSAKIIILQETPHLISVIRDISERKQIEEEIKLKNEELNKVNAEKDKFFSIIAHDLRSPFSGFLGLTELLAEDVQNMTMDRTKLIAQKMHESAVNIFRLLENLLEWSRMEHGLIHFNPENIQLYSLANESLTMIVDRAKSKEIEITNIIPEDLNVLADSNIIQSVIRNLVSNAVKFTPFGGKIILSSKIMTNKTLKISVSDTGIGMSLSMLENLFHLGVQTNRIGTDGEPSTGLGLLICKGFIERHGGKIWAESEEGKGSDFHFTIPGK